jgi:hypothetical protein
MHPEMVETFGATRYSAGSSKLKQATSSGKPAF